MKTLVTGATGFIGSNLVKFLMQRGDEVIAVGTSKEPQLTRFGIDLVDKPFFDLEDRILSGVEILFHQAAIADTRVNDEKYMNFINVQSSIKLFEQAVRLGCKNIVYASSTAIYGNSPAPYIEGKGELPLNVYGQSKLLLDGEVRKFAEKNPDIKIVGLRYCNVFGPGENHKGGMANMVYQLAQQMKKGNPKIFKWGEQKRDYVYVKDVVQANILASEAKESCIVNCGSGKPITFNEIIKELENVLGVQRETIYVDNPYKGYQNHTECDMTLAREKIGFSPKYSFKEAVREYFESGHLLIPPQKGIYP